MRRVILIVAAVVLALLVASQLLLPPIAASQIEHRLTKQGGHADVSVSAFPALRLLAHHGDRISITGDGLHVDLDTGRQKVFQNLDGFGQVHIRLTNVSAGPFVTQAFSLDRSTGTHTYALSLSGSFTPTEIASYLGSRVAGGLGGLFGGLAGGFMGGSQPVPVQVSAQVESNGGDPRVVSGAGSVAGVPMGPLLEVIVAGVVGRL